MKDEAKDILNIVLTATLIFGLFLWCLFKPATDKSESERRTLAVKPALSKEAVFAPKGSKTYMEQFEVYASDQFPLREAFRSIKSLTSKYLLGKKENNNLCYKNGYIFKQESRINMDSYAWSLNRIQYTNDKYLANSNVYFSIIPDKNYYMQGYDFLSYDYDAFFQMFINNTSSIASFIDLRNVLSLDNYYRTDTHWKQESLIPATDTILASMNAPTLSSLGIVFNENAYSNNFKGVYLGQLALPIKADNMNYLTASYMNDLEVYCYDTGKAEKIEVYDFEKAKGMDMYEIFLTGSRALITIENPHAISDKELIIFRDSFGSSIAPLLAASYSKVTLIDIRYISPAMLGRFVDFDNKDVLFLYCTQLLNNSIGQFNN